MKRVSIIGTVGLPANYGGFETFVSHLVDHIDPRQYALHVFCSSRRYEKKQRSYHGARLHYLPLDANGAQSIVYDALSLVWALLISDVVLVLGVSGCLLLPLLKPFTRKKVIVHIDGMEWQRSKWNSAIELFLKLSESAACRYADDIVADNQVVERYLSKAYNLGGALIAYGGDHVLREGLDAGWGHALGLAPRSYFFTVCRIEPENNVHMLLQVFALANKPYVVVGNWNSSEYGRSLRRKYECYDNLYLLDPVYDSHRLDSMRGYALAYVHGHSAGGTNPSLVEAMCHGLPILALDVSYNRATTQNMAWYFKDESDLGKLLDNFLEDKAREQGTTMRAIADSCYTWESIAAKYQWLFGRE